MSNSRKATGSVAVPRSATQPHSPWVTFAAIMLTIGAVANALFGYAALDTAHSRGALIDAAFIGPLSFWGWVSLLWAVVLAVGAYLLFARKPTGPTTGIVLATISAIVWVILLPTIQGLALLVIVLDVLVIYGLTVAKHAQA